MRNRWFPGVILTFSSLLAAAPDLRAQSPRVMDSRSSFQAVAATLPEAGVARGLTTVPPAGSTSQNQIGRPTYAGEGALIGALAAGRALFILTQGLCNSDSACPSGDMALPIIGGVAGGAILGLLIDGSITRGLP